MNTGICLRIVKGSDLSKISGSVSQRIGQGYQLAFDNKIYTTSGRYTKAGKRIVNINISSFIGLCGGATHYYATFHIYVDMKCGNELIGGYQGGVEIPEEYQTIEGEFVRPLTKEEKESNPDRWGSDYEVGDLVNAFESLEDVVQSIETFKKKFSSKEWKVEIRRSY